MKERGFTLLEILLVLAIITSIMILFIGFMVRRSEEARITNMVMTTQQILSASLNYYHDYGKWTDCTYGGQCELITGDGLPLLESHYLPNQSFFSLWPSSTTDYIQISPPTDKNFTVCIPISAGSATYATSDILASRLPLGRTSQTDNTTEPCGETVPTSPCEDETKPCRVITTVGVPGQNLNNAKSFNFAAVYHNGACVPIPVCPKGMKSDILVYPASVSGLNEGMSGTSGTSGDVSPISSFVAYAIGPSSFDKNDMTGSPGPSNCTGITGPGDGCLKNNTANNYLDPGVYWRVCLEIVTDKGKLAGTNWKAESGSVMALTRCVPDEPSGSDWDVFINK